jgi:uncharacterized membrane protein
VTTIQTSQQDKRVDEIIGTLLRVGVILAASIVLIGGVLYLIHFGSAPPHYRVFQGEPTRLRHISSIFSEAAALHLEAIIQLGLLVLIATPVARVLFTVFAFAYERDWTYVVITLIVLTLLLYSLGAWHF